MDYTTVERVKSSIGASEATDNDLLATHITSASRSIDRYCTGASFGDNYFETGDIVDEPSPSLVDKNGHIICFPRKPLINSISGLSYRFSPVEDWQAIDADLVFIEGGVRVVGWYEVDRQKIFSKLSYNGGLGADVDSLPEDIVEAATVLAARFYKESKTGLGDAIGVAELGTMVYTKAWPVRVREMLRAYIRRLPW